MSPITRVPHPQRSSQDGLKNVDESLLAHRPELLPPLSVPGERTRHALPRQSWDESNLGPEHLWLTVSRCLNAKTSPSRVRSSFRRMT